LDITVYKLSQNNNPRKISWSKFSNFKMKLENNAENPKMEKEFVASFRKSVSPSNGLLLQINLKRG
jgi:hypothetical protein